MKSKLGEQTINPTPESIRLRSRHGHLVDKKFLVGLTKAESAELVRINLLFDASEEEYYTPIKELLTKVRVSFLRERDEGMKNE